MFVLSNYPAFPRIINRYSFSVEHAHVFSDCSNILLDTDSLMHPYSASVSKDDTGSDASLRNKKYRKGDTLYYCDILRLSNQDYSGHVFAVFGYSYILERKGRSKIRIKYILKRERNYLSNIFYSKAIRIERKRVDMSVKKYMKDLEKKYPKVRMWGVLDANAIL
jgi:hypothetical protein